LAIETESGTNYLIKLVKVDNEKDFILVFVKGGETYSTKVPSEPTIFERPQA
jgi:hypothetical protein